MPSLPIKSDSMLRGNTPVEDHRKAYGLFVKREDLSCPPPGPPFSKARGVYWHVKSRPEKIVGVLDTSHSQAGHAVARACQVLGKACWNFYPSYKAAPEPKPPQLRAQALGAIVKGLPAGRSCILFHTARKDTESAGGYMMPNALKLPESVRETAEETVNTRFVIGLTGVVLIPASSGTIAAGVIRGLGPVPHYVVHLGYSRSVEQVRKYLLEASEVVPDRLTIIDEGYAYKDKARPGGTPPWPCNEYYDLKAFRWWQKHGRREFGTALFWNIG